MTDAQFFWLLAAVYVSGILVLEKLRGTIWLIAFVFTTVAVFAEWKG